MRSKLVIAGLTASFVMAFAATDASARNLSISHTALFNGIWRQLRFTASTATVAQCDLTLEGSFHYRTMSKVLHALIGHITRARINNCTHGSATVLSSRLPWHITYEGFEGTLPDITAVRLLLTGAELRIHEPVFGTECLARTSTTEPAVIAAELTLEYEDTDVRSLIFDPRPGIRCGILTFHTEGSGRMTELPNGAENILVSLI